MTIVCTRLTVAITKSALTDFIRTRNFLLYYYNNTVWQLKYRYCKCVGRLKKCSFLLLWDNERHLYCVVLSGRLHRNRLGVEVKSMGTPPPVAAIRFFFGLPSRVLVNCDQWCVRNSRILTHARIQYAREECNTLMHNNMRVLV